MKNFIGSFEMSLGIARLSSVTPCIEHENLVNDLWSFYASKVGGKYAFKNIEFTNFCYYVLIYYDHILGLT